MLSHLYPAPSSSLPAYPAAFFPSLLSPLPSSAFAALVESLLQHLAKHVRDIAPEKPNEVAKRIGSILEMTLGPAVVGGEALEAVVRTVLNVKGRREDLRSQAILRGSVSWIGASGDQGLFIWTRVSCGAKISDQIVSGDIGEHLDRRKTDSLCHILSTIL